MSDKLYRLLDSLEVSYIKHEHPAVFTCEEASKYLSHLKSPGNKNLFLRDKKGLNHFLVSVSQEKQVDLKELGKLLGGSKLSFGSPQRLEDCLKLEPGSVSILGLINDTERRVGFFIDRDLLQAELIQCHPLVNTATIEMKVDDLAKFLEHTGHGMEAIEIPVRE